LGQEPNTLYPLGQPNSAARAVLGAIYDGPVDVFANGYQPVILTQIPSLENGDAQLVPITVQRGDRVQDWQGNLVFLDIGTTVLPAGCSDDACAVKYEGGDFQMDQLIVTFRILPNLLWADGEPLTAEDSLYAYQLATDSATPSDKYLTDHTASYEALDEKTTQWWGLPGFIDPTYADNFFPPLPHHAWAWRNLSPAQLASASLEERPLLGWGAYSLAEWEPGKYIRLEKNPLYFRADLGLPVFNTLLFRFYADAPAAIGALVAGQCDILDPSLRLEGEIDLLTELERNDQVRLLTSSTSIMERLDFGLAPASYDDGYNLALGDRPNLFADARTRQAIAYCLDRPGVTQQVLAGLASVPHTYVSPDHPLFNPDAAQYPYDPNAGIALLEELGWQDTDQNPATPRLAVTVANIPAGTPLSLQYVTTSAVQRRQAAQILTQSLAQCGVQVNLTHLSQDELYAAGPDGILFGRKFDLAEYAVAVSGAEPACALLQTENIPSAENRWIGMNVSAYQNADFDALCRQANRTLPDQAEHAEAYRRSQQIFANDLPFIPLYMRIKAAVSRPDMCNFNLNAYTLNDLWNIEELDYAETCR
jgi:peptide/nickel transport system substrate-binding protein